MKKIASLTLLVSLSFIVPAFAAPNEFESCRCGNNIATKGDTKQEVLQKCGQPAAVKGYTGYSCYPLWVYNFGSNEFMQGVCFDGSGHVKKILSLDYGFSR